MRMWVLSTALPQFGNPRVAKPVQVMGPADPLEQHIVDGVDDLLDSCADSGPAHPELVSHGAVAVWGGQFPECDCDPLFHGDGGAQVGVLPPEHRGDPVQSS